MNEHMASRDHRYDAPSAFCPVYHHAMELIGKRWTGAILRVLLSGANRFSDVTAAVPGLSDRLLSERLKELEAEGIVVRTVTPSTPVRIAYDLTPKGRALNDVIAAVSQWAEEWVRPVDGAVSLEVEACQLEPAGGSRNGCR